MNDSKKIKVKVEKKTIPDYAEDPIVRRQFNSIGLLQKFETWGQIQDTDAYVKLLPFNHVKKIT